MNNVLGILMVLGIVSSTQGQSREEWQNLEARLQIINGAGTLDLRAINAESRNPWAVLLVRPNGDCPKAKTTHITRDPITNEERNTGGESVMEGTFSVVEVLAGSIVQRKWNYTWEIPANYFGLPIPPNFPPFCLGGYYVCQINEREAGPDQFQFRTTHGIPEKWLPCIVPALRNFPSYRLLYVSDKPGRCEDQIAALLASPNPILAMHAWGRLAKEGRLRRETVVSTLLNWSDTQLAVGTFQLLWFASPEEAAKRACWLEEIVNSRPDVNTLKAIAMGVTSVRTYSKQLGRRGGKMSQYEKRRHLSAAARQVFETVTEKAHERSLGDPELQTLLQQLPETGGWF